MPQANQDTPGRGVLLAIEGVDGLGKSTQAGLLAARLRAQGWAVTETREPTDGPWGRRIRALGAEARARLNPEDELDWFLRDRMEHVEQVIRPALRAGRIVITDRYYFSTMAYQGALGLDPARIREMNEALFPRPDLVLLLTGNPDTGLARIARGRPGGRDDAFEQAADLRRVAELFAGFGDAVIRRLDAEGPPDAVHARIWAEVVPLLAGPGESAGRS